MKIVKCSKCGRGFEMPDSYFGVIVCEACDPWMNEPDANGLRESDYEISLKVWDKFGDKSDMNDGMFGFWCQQQIEKIKE